MESNYNKALSLVLKYEGGYVNHPNDPGGATNKGITQGVYNAYRRQKGKEILGVQYIKDDEVNEIYKNAYWDKINASALLSGLDIAAFDFAVNSGVGRVNTYLLAHPKATAKEINDYRENFFKQIGVGKRSVFLKGWLNRLAAIRKETES